MSLWRSIKQKTAITVQAVKSKKDKNAEATPYDEAAAHYRILRDQIKILISDADNIRKAFPTVFKTIHEIGADMQEGGKILGGQAKEFVEKSGQFTSEFSDKQLKETQEHFTEKITQPLDNLSEQIKALKSLKKERRDTLLLLESNKEKLEKFTKSQKKEEISHYTEKINSRETILTTQTNKFITDVETIWNNKEQTFGTLVNNLNEIVFEIVNNLSKGYEPLVSTLPPSDLQFSFE